MSHVTLDYLVLIYHAYMLSLATTY